MSRLIGGTVTPQIKRFVEQREEVVTFIRQGLLDQGADKIEASQAVMPIYTWKVKDIENLHKCINSDFDENVIKAIVSHDFNGLSRGDSNFVPKSRQFEEN